jgi:putative DNA primase/helicase
MVTRKTPAGTRETLSRMKKGKGVPAASPATPDAQANGRPADGRKASPSAKESPVSSRDEAAPAEASASTAEREGRDPRELAAADLAAAHVAQVEAAQVEAAAVPSSSAERVGRPSPANGSNGHPAAAAAGRPKQLPALMTADRLIEAPQQYIWEPFLPEGSLVLVTGDTEAGKSTFFTRVAAMMSGGPPIEGKRNRPPGRVLVYASEEKLSSKYKPRLLAADADMARITFGDLLADGKRAPYLQLPEDMALLRRRVEESQISLLLLDPLDGYLDAAFNEGSKVHIRKLLTSLTELAEDLSCLVMYTLHPRKSRTGGAKRSVSGSAAWTEVPRVLLSLGYDPHNPAQRVLSMAKNNDRKDKPSRLFNIKDVEGHGLFVLGRPTGMTADDTSGEADSPADRDARADAIAFLKDLLEGGDVATTLVQTKAQAAFIAPITLKRAKKDLGITAVKIQEGTAGHWAYHKPDEWPE